MPEDLYKWREKGCRKDGPEPGTLTCDFYAKFMSELEKERPGLAKDLSYAQTWAKRFRRGDQFQYADLANRRRLLNIMIEGTGGGNAPHIDKDTLKSVCEKYCKD